MLKIFSSPIKSSPPFSSIGDLATIGGGGGGGLVLISKLFQYSQYFDFYGRVDPNRSVFVIKVTDETEKLRNYVTACVAQ